MRFQPCFQPSSTVSSGHLNGGKALISGITGQHSSYLAEFLLSKGYEVHGILACNGMLFNHESPRRGGAIVTRDIAPILAGEIHKLYMGNSDAKRDWGYAKEYVQATLTMLQQDQLDDYVIATGQMHSVRDLPELIARLVCFDGETCWDPTKPNGPPVCALDTSCARERLRFTAETHFEQGLRQAKAWYEAHRAELTFVSASGGP